MTLIDEYLDYVRYARRYSPRTVQIYEAVLSDFITRCVDLDGAAGADAQNEALLRALNTTQLRNYEVWLMDERKMQPKTVVQHISALSAFCKYLLARKLLTSNPAAAIKRPKLSKRLPQFYRDEALEAYFKETAWWASEEALEMYSGEKGALERNARLKEAYLRRLSRLILSLLYGTGIRRAELISLDRSSLDTSRQVLSVRGKGDKMRTIPLIISLFKEILLYLKAVDMLIECEEGPTRPLLVTVKGGRLYPSYVERVVKSELGAVDGISGRLSPHVLRHSLATQLLNEGGDLNSIKEMLGHSSLAATQVYTHNSIAQLSKVYQTAHPRAKKRR